MGVNAERELLALSDIKKHIKMTLNFLVPHDFTAGAPGQDSHYEKPEQCDL